MPIKVTNSFDAKRGMAIASFIYGAPGSGKTRAIETLPDPCLIDLERGYGTLTKNIMVIECETLADVKEAIIHAIKSGKRSIGFDSLPRLYDVMTNEILKTNNLKILRIQDYGIMAKAIKDLMWGLKTRNMVHVMVTAYPKEEKDEETGSIYVRPDVSPSSLRCQLPGIFDILGYLVVNDDGKRIVHVKANKRFYAKSRITKDDIKTVEPDFGKLIESYYGAIPDGGRFAPITTDNISSIDLSDDNAKEDDSPAIGHDQPNEAPNDAPVEEDTPLQNGDDVAEKPDIDDDMPVTPEQLAEIRRVVSKRFGTSNDKKEEYRNILKENFKTNSAKSLSSGDADKLIKMLENK